MCNPYTVLFSLYIITKILLSTKLQHVEQFFTFYPICYSPDITVLNEWVD